jgi:hypothetical protein
MGPKQVGNPAILAWTYHHDLCDPAGARLWLLKLL